MNENDERSQYKYVQTVIRNRYDECIQGTNRQTYKRRTFIYGQ